MHLPGTSGILGSLRNLADGLMGSLHDRLELLAIELKEEKVRLIQIFIWISAVMILALLAVIFTSLAVVVVWWETARVTVVFSLAGFYIVAFLGVVMAFRRYLNAQPKPFATTLGELQEDHVCIRTKN